MKYEKSHTSCFLYYPMIISGGNSMKKIILTLLFFILFSLGISLQLKADIGQSVFNAFCLSFAKYFHLKIGIVINICNMVLFVLYIIIKKTIKLQDLLQFVYIMMNGLLVDLILGKLLLGLVIESYILNVTTFLVGLFIAAFSLGQILRIGLVKFPLESLCIEVAKRTTFSFSRIRYSFDFIFVIGAISIFILDQSIMTIREGTIISFFLLSYLISASYKLSIGRGEKDV